MSTRSILAVAFVLVSSCLTGCATHVVSKSKRFPLMYEEKPLAILVLPPVNATTAADAKEYYGTTISEPLAYLGYYVLPMEITNDVLKNQGLYDTEIIGNQPLNKFGEYFGADAVLFTKITKWNKSYMVVASSLTVSVDAQLKSTKTNRILWEYSGTIVADLSGRSSGGGIAGLVAAALVTAINSAVADYVPYARLANVQLLQSMPVGKYHARNGQDGNDPIADARALN
jgi:hypothetical protein